MSNKSKKVTTYFIINHLAFFVSHRLPIAVELLKKGNIVGLIVGKSASKKMDKEAKEIISEHDIKIHEINFSSSGLNPFKETIGLMQMIKVLKLSSPDIVHCASPKGIIMGGISSLFHPPKAIVFAISGMGHAFSGADGTIGKILKFVYLFLTKIAFKHRNKKIIVQNTDDLNLCLKNRLCDENELVLIKGSGIKTKLFEHIDLSSKENIILFPARLLKDKGFNEFIRAAITLNKKYKNWKFFLAGTDDYESPNSISRQEVNQLRKLPFLKFLGHTKNIDDYFKRASIVCLPSYREGMPKALLEAQAAGCPVVTTDTVGCRESILDNQTGYLVPLYNSSEIAKKLEKLILDNHLREKMGKKGIEFASNFEESLIISKILDVYNALLNLEQ